MATAFVNFTGKERQGVTFPATLNSQTYRCEIKWLLAAQRWYLTVYDAGGNRVLTTPLVESSSSTAINLIAGFFDNAAIIWRYALGKVEIQS